MLLTASATTDDVEEDGNEDEDEDEDEVEEAGGADAEVVGREEDDGVPPSEDMLQSAAKWGAAAKPTPFYTV